MKPSKTKSSQAPSVNKNANPKFVGHPRVRHPIGGARARGPAQRGGIAEDLGKR